MAYKIRYLVVAVAGLALASGAAWWWQNKPVQAPTGAAAPAPAGAASGPGGPGGGARMPGVEVAKVETMRLVDETQAVGNLRSRQGVMLRPEISGRIKQMLVADGQKVRKGQLLVQFDDQLPQAQLAQSRAELSIAEANHKRNVELVAQNFVSKRSADESAAALEVAKARLALSEATVQRLKILAPFDGTVGLRQVNVGDYLKDGADIINIEDMDALLVDFRLPERFQSRIRPGQSAQVEVDALPGQKFTAQIQAVDPLVDANGRSVGLRGCIDNHRMQLRPGMFARVNAIFGVREKALVIPEEAIIPQGGRSFVVKLVPGEKPEEQVSQRVAVVTGLRLPGRVEVIEGLAVGDTVVTAGHQRLQKDGTAVRVIDMSRGRPGAGGPGAGAPGAPAGAASAPAGGASAAGAAPAGAPPMAGAGPRGPGMGGAGGPGMGGRPGGPGAARPMPALEGPNPCLRG